MIKNIEIMIELTQKWESRKNYGTLKRSKLNLGRQI